MDQHDHKGKNYKHHVVPFKIYFLVWVGLIIGTIVTVVSSYWDFGTLNIAIAMAIATVKAMLVILFFMGLKYDGLENAVTFFGSFVFLAIFIWLAGSDLFYRNDPRAAIVDASDLQQSAEPVDMSKLIKPTPALLEKGKQIFAQQCSTCHGAQGKGDGPAAAALNPKPRNFTSTEGWKKGRTLSKVFDTVTNGLPGTPMPPFSGMSVEDRFALSHYVRTLTPNAPADSGAELTALAQMGGASKPRIPVAVAMEKLAEPQPQITDAAHAVEPTSLSTGSGVYSSQCLSCHGVKGQGGIEVQTVGVNPPLRLTTRPLRVSGSLAEFQRQVSEGIPGRAMPGFAHFSSEQWQALYQYVKSLR